MNTTQEKAGIAAEAAEKRAEEIRVAASISFETPEDLVALLHLAATIIGSRAVTVHGGNPLPIVMMVDSSCRVIKTVVAQKMLAELKNAKAKEEGAR